jgi:hypothetical protein
MLASVFIADAPMSRNAELPPVRAAPPSPPPITVAPSRLDRHLRAHHLRGELLGMIAPFFSLLSCQGRRNAVASELRAASAAVRVPLPLGAILGSVILRVASA